MKEKKESNKHVNKKRTYRQNPKTNSEKNTQYTGTLKETHTLTKRGKKKEEKIKTGTRKEEGIQANELIHSEKLKTRLQKEKEKRKHGREYNILK